MLSIMNQVRNPHPCCSAFICIAAAIFALSCRSGNSSKNIPFITPGAVVDQELAPGQVEAFQIILDAGQYSRIAVQQHGIEATLAILGPEGHSR